jgi:metal-dependent HD superfamily phosphatase/phosphodiesterase
MSSGVFFRAAEQNHVVAETFGNRVERGLETPLTLEAGIVRTADALDMAKGRSRIPFSSGSLSIHSVSAAAVESVKIESGEDKPIRVTVELSNSAGLFQLDQLLRNKLNGSGLEEYLEIQATVGEQEKRLLTDFSL